jgi:hypothetical protein
MDEELKEEVLEFIDSLNFASLSQDQINKANELTYKLSHNE